MSLSMDDHGPFEMDGRDRAPAVQPATMADLQIEQQVENGMAWLQFYENMAAGTDVAWKHAFMIRRLPYGPMIDRLER